MMKTEAILEGYLAGILANVSTLLLLGFAAYVGSLIINLRRRQAFARVLGATSTLPDLCIYFSRLQVKPGGTEGAEDVSQDDPPGYSGPAVVKIEYDAARMIWDHLRINWLGYLWITVHEILSGNRPHFAIREAEIDISPPLSQVSGSLPNDMACSFVLVGGPVYNALSKKLQQRTDLPFSFRRVGNTWAVVHHTEHSAEALRARENRPPRELGFIQRITIDEQTGQRVVWCAGIGSGATYGVVKYLCIHWRDLQRKYTNQDFSICLAFHDVSGDKVDVIPSAEPEVLFDKPRSGKPLAVYTEGPSSA